MRRLSATLIAFALASCSKAPESAALVTPAPVAARVAHPVEMDTLEIMIHAMDPAARNFWSAWGEVYDNKGLHDVSAKTDEDWIRVENGAASVIVASNMLMLPEYRRAPEADWIKHAEKVANLGLKGKDAAERHDLSVMEALGADLDVACGECHKQFGPAATSPTAQ